MPVLWYFIFFIPAVLSAIWGIYCWTPRRLKGWVVANIFVISSIALFIVPADDHLRQLLKQIMGLQFTVLVPITMIQIVVIAFLHHRRALKRKRAELSTRFLSNGLSGEAAS